MAAVAVHLRNKHRVSANHAQLEQLGDGGYRVEEELRDVVCDTARDGASVTRRGMVRCCLSVIR